MNSYLHVGVERGLPFLVGVLGMALAIVSLAFVCASDRNLQKSKRDLAHLLGGLAASLLVFFGANFFSTLWIFENLWWWPLASALGIFCGAWWLRGRGVFPLLGKVAGCSAGVALFFGAVLYGASLSIENGLLIERQGGAISVVNKNYQEEVRRKILVLPDRSTLGENWGKEVRRLIQDESFQDAEVVVSLEDVELSARVGY
ncbi:hypothetical protein [Roseibacillus ishigakijimensis]|uniref:hypothetical protein n=1 Tax=Roseibacillus ishigakijimensis TaxID=454146 RepID=UPI001903F6C3|nr:hypothetical protein [Roseibacillus ishigakijimensis]